MRLVVDERFMAIALEAGRPFIFFGLNVTIRHDLLSTIGLNSVIISETAENDKGTRNVIFTD